MWEHALHIANGGSCAVQRNRVKAGSFIVLLCPPSLSQADLSGMVYGFPITFSSNFVEQYFERAAGAIK